MLMYSHSCVADILFTMYVRFKETIGTGYKTEMRFRPNNSYWSNLCILICWYSFLYMSKCHLQYDSLDFSLKTVWRDNQAKRCSSCFGIYYTHGFAYTCCCLSVFFFDSEVDV